MLHNFIFIVADIFCSILQYVASYGIGWKAVKIYLEYGSPNVSIFLHFIDILLCMVVLILLRKYNRYYYLSTHFYRITNQHIERIALFLIGIFFIFVSYRILKDLIPYLFF